MTQDHSIQSRRETEEWGRPEIAAATCTGCGLCVAVCPARCLTLHAGRAAVSAGGPFGCLACGHCLSICPTGAIRITGRGLRDGDRLDLPPPAARADAAALAGLLEARRSLRFYDDRPVAKDVVDRLLEMAATAPMGFPPSPVGVLVVHGRERVREFAQDVVGVCHKWLFLGTPFGRIVQRLLVDRHSANLMQTYVLPIVRAIVAGRKEGRDLLFYDAPCVLVFHHPGRNPIDSVIACSFATVAAEALGLGSCMIGTVPHALQGDRQLKTKWALPPDRTPGLAMTLGYPARRFAHGVRRRFAAVQYV